LDVDGDGRSELVVVVGPGASVSYVEIFHINDHVSPVRLEPPGDPAGLLSPGTLLLGGSHDAVSESGFLCRIDPDGSRALVAWQAQRDDGTSPWSVHLTTLDVRNGRAVVVATEDRDEVAELPSATMCA
jgi:hypothetical protein